LRHRFSTNSLTIPARRKRVDGEAEIPLKMEALPDEILTLILSGAKARLGTLSVLCGIGHTNKKFRRLSYDARLWSARDFEFLPLEGIFHVLRLLNDPEELESFSLNPSVPFQRGALTEPPQEGPDAPWPLDGPWPWLKQNDRYWFNHPWSTWWLERGHERLLDVWDFYPPYSNSKFVDEAKFASQVLSPLKLKELRFGVTPPMVVDFFLDRPFSCLTSLSCKISWSIARRIQSVPLCSLHLNLDCFRFEVHILPYLPSLTSLSLRSTDTSSISYTEPLLGPIAQCCPAVKYLHLKDHVMPDIRLLAIFCNLTHLDMCSWSSHIVDVDFRCLPQLKRLRVLVKGPFILALSSASLECIHANCEKLRFTHCPLLVTLTCFVNESVLVRECPLLQHVDVLGCKSFEIQDCPSLTSIRCQGLKCSVVPCQVHWCALLRTIELCSSRYIRFECVDCPALTTIKCYGRAEFKVLWCASLETIIVYPSPNPDLTQTLTQPTESTIETIETLTKCATLDTNTPFGHLECHNCPSLTTVNGISKVIMVGACPQDGLQGMSSTGGSVVYKSCPSLRTVTSLASLLTVIDCPNLEIVRALRCTRRLHCYDCPSLTAIRHVWGHSFDRLKMVGCSSRPL